MALPTPSKTWQYDKNKGPYTSLSDLELAWKRSLTEAASGAWTVVRSCGRVGGVTWTAGATDYWGTGLSNTIAHANEGSSHAWIVLKQTGIASNFQICLNLVNNDGGGPSVHMMYVSASAGFTGGTTTNRPTATDEIACQTGIKPQWTDAQNLATYPARLNVFQSTDGECTRWSIWLNNLQTAFCVMDKPRNTVSGWTNPWIYVGATTYYNYATAGNFATYGFLHDANTRTFVGQGSTSGSVYLTSEALGGNNQAIGRVMTFGGDLDSGFWPFLPIGIYCSTAGLRGRLGELYDLWWGSVTPNDGDNYPADATRLFVQMNDLILPWGGGAALLRS